MNLPNPDPRICKILTEIRKAANIRMCMMANEIGLTVGQLSAVEAGYQPLTNTIVDNICNITGTKVSKETEKKLRALVQYK